MGGKACVMGCKAVWAMTEANCRPTVAPTDSQCPGAFSTVHLCTLSTPIAPLPSTLPYSHGRLWITADRFNKGGTKGGTGMAWRFLLIGTVI